MKPCIEHGLRQDKGGYNVTSRGGRTIKRHRLVLADYLGVDPFTMQGDVLHKCSNSKCIEPTHLYLGDHLQNMVDRDEAGNTAAGARHGMSKLSEEDVQFIKDNHVRGVNRSKPSNTAALALRFGVSENQVLRIANGRQRVRG